MPPRSVRAFQMLKLILSGTMSPLFTSNQTVLCISIRYHIPPWGPRFAGFFFTFRVFLPTLPFLPQEGLLSGHTFRHTPILTPSQLWLSSLHSLLRTLPEAGFSFIFLDKPWKCPHQCFSIGSLPGTGLLSPKPISGAWFSGFPGTSRSISLCYTWHLPGILALRLPSPPALF